MICTCLYMWDSDNLTPWAPFGGAGTIRASTLAFFAFLGFEEASNDNLLSQIASES